MKRFFLVLAALILPAVLQAAEREDRPHWSFEIKGGRFAPDIDNWAENYGSSYHGQYGGSLAYKLLRQVEAGIEGTYGKDTGAASAPLHGTTTGRVTFETAPLNVFVLFRGIFTEGQWIVPYGGGGWTRMYYRTEVEDQGVVRGSTDGYHARGGLQFLLDGIDPHAASNMFNDYGIYHTYFFLEAKYVRAEIDTVASGAIPSQSVNLGGTGYFGGFLFEF
ncbi:MAG: hypothetical protein A2010_08095 [Nitrospirae bacterium GWD2_57_9]|nr:MAG: hypothetical protein A2010_08095 [Nitrospirae bacterium GWD2_57_9]